MRILRVITVLLSAVVFIAGTVIYFTSSHKKEAPILTCTVTIDQPIECNVDTPDEELLKYVSAYDRQDGDISDQIKIVRKKHLIDNKNTVIVMFAVCDSDNNVASLSRQLVLTDYHPPRISLSSDFIFQSGHTFSVSKYVNAYDVVDGDLSLFVKLISTEFTNIEGEYPINIKVSNSMGDSTEMTINAIVTNEDYVNVKIQLDNYAYYCNKGAEIDYMSLVTGINNLTNKTYETESIIVDDSQVDTSTPGVYNAFYKIVDEKNEKVITMTRLVVIVTED